MPTRRGTGGRPGSGPQGRRSTSRQPSSGASPRPAARTRPGPAAASRAAANVAESPDDAAAPGQRRSSFTSRAALLALVLVVLAVSYAYPLRTWLEQRSDIADLRAESADLEAQVRDLEAQEERWEDPAYVQQQARERLHFVLPGELGYIVVDGAGDEVGALPETTGVVAPEATGHWWERLWGTVETAGAEPAVDDAAQP